jgi:hypothetical protein
LVALGGWLIWKKSSEPPVGEGFNLCFTANTLGKEAQIEAIWGRLKWLELITRDIAGNLFLSRWF